MVCIDFDDDDDGDDDDDYEDDDGVCENLTIASLHKLSEAEKQDIRQVAPPRK